MLCVAVVHSRSGSAEPQGVHTFSFIGTVKQLSNVYVQFIFLPAI